MLIGGIADYYAVPEDENDLRTLLRRAVSHNMDYFILGGGSNILVADNGIRGLVVDMRLFKDFVVEDNLLVLGSGLDVSRAAWRAGLRGLMGLDFLFGMPGSIGGAIWMNARCYGKEIADVLEWVDYMDNQGRITRLECNSSQWTYKVSPFQTGKGVILRGAFRVIQSNPEELKKTMLLHRNDRESKGHYRAPCAGSAFKNNRNFGAPSGAIIDECGLKGFHYGRAAVSEWHANIFINMGGARATEVQKLLEKVAIEVRDKKGFQLETELLMVGDWVE